MQVSDLVTGRINLDKQIEDKYSKIKKEKK